MTKLPGEPDGLPEDWWTNDDCAAALGIGYNTWTSYVSRGRVPEPARRFGRSSVWRPDDIRAWRRRQSIW